MINYPDFSRLFFALWPDDQTILKLASLGKSIEAKGFIPVLPQNFHVTLVFLGNIDVASELLIKHCVTGISANPFSLAFDQLTYWSKPKVLCLSCLHTPEGVELLVASLNREVARCGLQTETRRYVPHVTLARHARYLPDINIEPIVWCAESFCLIESCTEPDGVNYRVRQKWPLVKTAL